MTEWINNLYLINTILNICSTTFTLLFLLYRFTSLFSYIIGFIKFCGKLFNGIIYLKNLTVNYYYNRTSQITQDTTYTIDTEYGLNESSDHYYTSDGFVFRSVYSNETFFNKIKRKAYNLYHYIYPKKNEYNVIPIYETRTSYIDDQLAGNNGNNCNNGISNITNTQIEKNLIIDHINNLLDEEDSDSISSAPLLWFDQQSPHNSAYNQYNQYDPLGNYNKLTPAISVTNSPTTPITNSVSPKGDLNSEYNNYFNTSLNKQFNNEFKPFNNEFKPFNDFDKPPFNNNFNSSNSSNSSNIINRYNTMDATPAFVNPDLFVNHGNTFVNKLDKTGSNSSAGCDVNLNGMSDQSESDYKSEYSSSTTSNSNAMDLINKFQNLSLKLN